MADTFISMKLTKAEMKEEKAETSMPYSSEYPWGLQISLDESSLKKLGITKLPGVGDQLSFDIQCKVTSVSANDSEETGERQNVSMQITDMCVEDMDEAPDPVAKGSRIV